MADGEPGAALRLQRVDGAARVAFKAGADGARSRLADLFQRGAAKIRLPNAHDGPVEAVLLNASGGVTAGDRLSYGVTLGPGAVAVISTQAAERVYRAVGDTGAAVIRNAVALGPGARLDWLAQETILFEGGRLDRRLEVQMAEDAAFLGVEPLVFGREAMGERLRRGALSDQWRIRRGGRLVYADGVRLTNDPSARDLASCDLGAALERPAALGGRRAAASLVYAAPDAEDRLGALRAILAELTASAPSAGGVLAGEGALAAASAWDGVLSARLTAPSGASLMRLAASALEAFRRAPTPRVWRC